MTRIVAIAVLLLAGATAPALAEKAPTLKILTASGFGCKAVDEGILHCKNPNTKDEYDCSPNPDAPCVGTAPTKLGTGGGALGNRLHGDVLKRY
jgi:hypothetical protein